MIRVEMNPGTTGRVVLRLAEKRVYVKKIPIAILCIVVICVMDFYLN
jgi:hypothetical protein